MILRSTCSYIIGINLRIVVSFLTESFVCLYHNINNTLCLWVVLQIEKKMNELSTKW